MAFFSAFAKSSWEELWKKALGAINKENFHQGIGLLKKSLASLPKEQEETILTRAKIYQKLGEIYLLIGSLKSAKENLEKSIQLVRESQKNSLFPMWKNLSLLGELWLVQGELPLALENLHQARQKAEEEGGNSSSIYRNLGRCYLLQAKYNQAIEQLHLAIIKDEVGNSESLAQSMLQIGYLCHLLGKSEQAWNYLHNARKLFFLHRKKRLQILENLLEGLLWREKKNYTQSLKCFEQAATISQSLHLLRLHLRVEEEMALTYIYVNDIINFDRVLKSMEKKIAHHLSEELHARWSYLLAWQEHLNGSQEGALDIIQTQLEVVQGLGFAELLWQLYYLQGRVYAQMGKTKEAGESYVAALEKLKNIWSTLNLDLKEDYFKNQWRVRVKNEVERFYYSIE